MSFLIIDNKLRWQRGHLVLEKMEDNFRFYAENAPICVTFPSEASLSHAHGCYVYDPEFSVPEPTAAANFYGAYPTWGHGDGYVPIKAWVHSTDSTLFIFHDAEVGLEENYHYLFDGTNDQDLDRNVFGWQVCDPGHGWESLTPTCGCGTYPYSPCPTPT